MSKSKVIATALCIAIAALLIGNVSAYFVTSERAHNIITTGGLGIDLIEDTDRTGNDGRPIPFEDIKDVMPGSVISKIPRVHSTDNSAAWVRIRVKVTAANETGEIEQDASRDVAIDYNTRYWLNGGDGYWYYYRSLEPHADTEPLFTTVTFGGELTSAGVEKYNIELQAFAVQVANNGATVLEAEGWPEE